MSIRQTMLHTPGMFSRLSQHCALSRSYLHGHRSNDNHPKFFPFFQLPSQRKIRTNDIRVPSSSAATVWGSALRHRHIIQILNNSAAVVGAPGSLDNPALSRIQPPATIFLPRLRLGLRLSLTLCGPFPNADRSAFPVILIHRPKWSDRFFFFCPPSLPTPRAPVPAEDPGAPLEGRSDCLAHSTPIFNIL